MKQKEKKRRGAPKKMTSKDIEIVESAYVAHNSHSQFADAIASFANDSDFVTSLGRGLAVLSALSDKKRRMSIAQVSQITAIPRAAARRSLHTLEKLEFVAMDDTRRFYLRPRILSFSHSYLSASPIAMIAQPILDRLGESLEKGCAVAVLDGKEIIYLARSASSRVIHPSLNAGRRLPAFCSSIGRVLLAHLPERELNAYLTGTRFEAYTSRTVTDRNELRRILEEVRKRGFAYAREQIEPGICSLAVPVRDCEGRFVAGLNVVAQGQLQSGHAMAEQFHKPLEQAAREFGMLLLP